jgi:hypothetical protein
LKIFLAFCCAVRYSRSEFYSLQLVFGISVFDLVRAGVLAARYCFTILFTAKFRSLVISYLALLALRVCYSICALGVGS